MTWPRTNFRVIIGTVELSCAEVLGFASQTTSGSGAGEPRPGIGNESAALADVGAASAGGGVAQGSGTPWANQVGPWIGSGPDGHPPNARTPALAWTLTPVTLRRAVDQSRTLFTWRAAIVAGQPDTREVAVQVLDSPGGQPVAIWRLHDAWPLSWSGPALDALLPGVALEQAELAYARLQWLNPSQTGET